MQRCPGPLREPGHLRFRYCGYLGGDFPLLVVAQFDVVTLALLVADNPRSVVRIDLLGKKDDRPDLDAANLGCDVGGYGNVDVFQNGDIADADVYQTILVDVPNCLGGSSDGPDEHE
jgi:hypothetical protein